jgi:phage tail-like protein
MPPSSRDSPLLDVGHFTVLIGDVDTPFTSVSSLTSETEPPADGEARFRTVVLRRALGTSKDLFRWRQAVAEGKRDHRRVVIRQLDPAGERIVNAWVLEGAWPCRWSAPAFDAAGEGVAVEEIELAFDRLEWIDGSEVDGDGRTA